MKEKMTQDKLSKNTNENNDLVQKLEENLSLQDRVLNELNKNDFPDLKFLYSDEVLNSSLEILRNLLKEEKEKFNAMLETPDNEINFDTFDYETNLWYFWHLLNHLQWVDRNDKIDKIIETFEPEYIDFANEVAYSKRYFQMLLYCLQNCKLDSDQKRIIEETIKDFRLRWIDLPEEQQDKLKQIDKELAKLSQDFSMNIVKDKSWFTYHITSFEDIKDLPENTLSSAKKLAEEKWLDWYLFTADPTQMMDLISYSSNPKIREDIYKQNHKFASSWEYDNRENVLKILKLKEEKAKILAYKNYAELSLVNKMADSPEQVVDLIEWISQKARNKAKEEIELLKKYFNLDELKASDLAYYSRLYKEKEYKIDPKVLKEYLEFNNVLDYLHKLVWKLYWVSLKQVSMDTYNSDVKIYKVYKDGEFISYYFLDAFYRPTKRPWAWADNLREKDYKTGRLPIVVNVCNFQKVDWKELLLSLRDVETLFHEFWHALHEMLSESPYAELSWFNVEWDFVELPSQLHENWVSDKESLEKLSKHYKTGKSLPNEILDNLEKLSTYMKWNFVARQNELALLDMFLYMEKSPNTVDELDKKALDIANRYSVFEKDKDYKMYASFWHIFGWGYAAGYYSYMWAEIIEKDIWEEIKKHWIFNTEITKRFLNTILSQWSRKPAKELFYDFMGREVDSNAFMKINWLV